MTNERTDKDLTDDEITEMARKSRFARELEARDIKSHRPRRFPPGAPPAAAGANAPKPKAPAGGAAECRRAEDE